MHLLRRALPRRQRRRPNPILGFAELAVAPNAVVLARLARTTASGSLTSVQGVERFEPERGLDESLRLMQRNRSIAACAPAWHRRVRQRGRRQQTWRAAFETPNSPFRRGWPRAGSGSPKSTQGRQDGFRFSCSPTQARYATTPESPPRHRPSRPAAREATGTSQLVQMRFDQHRERISRSIEPGFHCSQVARRDLCDFFVRLSLKLTKHKHFSMMHRQTINRCLHQ